MWLIMMWSEEESAIVDSCPQPVQQNHCAGEHNDDDDGEEVDDDNDEDYDDAKTSNVCIYNFQMNWHAPIYARPCHEGKMCRFLSIL